MNTQELLILSFFHRTIPKQLTNDKLTVEMIEAGIGTNSASQYDLNGLINKLISKNLLNLYKDPLLQQKGLVSPRVPQLYILTDKATTIAQRQDAKKSHEEFVTELEFNKLKAEHNLLVSQLADYDKTKYQANIAIIISVISVLVAIIALFLK